MKAFLKDLFSYKWRWNRLKFWLYPLAIQLPIMIVIIGSVSTLTFQWYMQDAMEAKISAIENQLETVTIAWLNQDTTQLEIELEETKTMLSESPNGNVEFNLITMIIMWLFYILSIYVQIVTYIKRFHDLGRSGWYTLIMFIPFISILGIIWLGFFKWTSGPNKYGPDPLGWTTVEAPTWEL